MTTESRSTDWRRQAHLQWLVWLGVMVVIGGFIVSTQWRELVNTDTAEREHLQTQVRVAERIMNGQVASVDAALRTMLAGIDRWRGADGGFLPFAHEHLQRVEAMMPGAEAFLVLDPQGVCQLSSVKSLVGADFSSAVFFVEARKSFHLASLNISQPHGSQLSGWSVTLSRPVVAADGQFNGLVAAALAPDYFQSLMSNLRYSEDMRVSLVHRGGSVYVSSPAGGDRVLPTFGNGESYLSRHLQAGQEESYIDAKRADGTEQIGMVRTVSLTGPGTAPVFVAVASRDVPVIHAQWMRDNFRHGGIFAALLLLSGAFLWMYQRRDERAQAIEARNAAELLRSNQRYEQIANTIPCVLFDFEVPPQGKPTILYVGPYCQTLLGVSSEAMLGTSNRFFEAMHPDDVDAFVHAWTGALSRGEPLDHEFRYLRVGTELRWLRMSATPGLLPTAEGAVHWSGYLIDISDSKFHELAMQTLAYQDPLTNANNRRSFMDKVHLELDRVHRTGSEASLLMLDVDFFKRINDTHGHDVGDEALKHLVSLLQQQLRSIDTLGRLGGEEFAILLPETALDAALHLAERLRHAVESTPLPRDPQPLQFTVSLGVTVMNAASRDVNTVIKQADEAMYEAKHTGRNRVCQARST